MHSLFSFVLLALSLTLQPITSLALPSPSPSSAAYRTSSSPSTYSENVNEPCTGDATLEHDDATLALGHHAYDNSNFHRAVGDGYRDRLARSQNHKLKAAGRSWTQPQSQSQPQPQLDKQPRPQSRAESLATGPNGRPLPAPALGKFTAMSGASVNTSSSYQIVEQWAGDTFFEGWDFFTDDDPTNGLVNYVGQDEAMDGGLAFVLDGVAYMQVDSWTNLGAGQKRNSVRISSHQLFDGGLFVADIKSMPYGLATWPAFWTVGTDWPTHGEIDIIEGVNNNTHNQYTVHAASGCTIDTSTSVPPAFLTPGLSSSIASTSCESSPTSNNGCAFIDSSDTSYGAPLNEDGGAVFVMEWTSEGVRVWMFPRGNVPVDLESQRPDPGSWSRVWMKAAWSSVGCDAGTFFRQHAVTFDITLCGDWAGNAFPGGQEACAAYVQTASNFKDAIWAVNSVSVYQLS